MLLDPPANILRPARSVATSDHTTADHDPYDPYDPYPSLKGTEELLDVFRTKILGSFPFMIMPIYVDAHQFRAERPFLWLCIVAVASRSSHQQAALGKKLRMILGQKMLVECERTLDMLFGIIAYIGWSGIAKPCIH